MKNDLTGKRFGRLTAKFVCGKSKYRHYLWHCVCDCGNEVVVPSNGLTCGHTQSCGCLQRDKTSEARTKHGASGNHREIERLYRVWISMRARCNNPNNKSFKYYGSRMFWFDKENPDVEFVDIREIDREKIWESKDGTRSAFLDVHPTTIADFTDLPFKDNTFYHIVFDPPHITDINENAWIAKKYGKLPNNWEQLIHDGFWECMRVLKPNGTLIFKWSEIDIPLSKLLKVIGTQPLYGHRSGKHMTTHWMAFIKDEVSE